MKIRINHQSLDGGVGRVENAPPVTSLSLSSSGAGEFRVTIRTTVVYVNDLFNFKASANVRHEAELHHSELVLSMGHSWDSYHIYGDVRSSTH